MVLCEEVTFVVLVVVLVVIVIFLLSLIIIALRVMERRTRRLRCRRSNPRISAVLGILQTSQYKSAFHGEMCTLHVCFYIFGFVYYIPYCYYRC